MTIPTEIKRRAHSLVNQGQLSEAKPVLLEAHQIDPADPDILLGLGVAHAREGDFISAKDWLAKAIEVNPGNPGIHIHLGNTLCRLQNFDDAKFHYQTAISLQPDIFEAHYFLAGLLMSDRQLEDAEYHFKYAISLQPDNSDCHANLGQVYELKNNLINARNCANEALRFNNNHIGALFLLGKVDKRENNYSDAKALFKRVLDSATDETLIATATIELAQTLDKLGLYDEACEAFLAGKAAWSRIADKAPFDKQEYQKRIAQNTKWYSKENIDNRDTHAGISDAIPDPVFFVGFPRSGTTLAEQILNQHPRVITSNERPFLQNLMEETAALPGKDLSSPENVLNATGHDIARLRESYWKKVRDDIENWSEDNILVDKQPLNLVDLGFISRVFPNAPVLVAIRDPRDVCLSCFMQGFILNPAMINFLSMDSTVSFYNRVMGLWLHYRSVLPIHWYQYRYEDLIDDFETTTRGIFDFLGLEYPENAENFHIAAQKRLINNPSYQDVTTPIYSRSKARWKHYEKFMAPHMETLRPYLNEFDYS